MIKRRMLLVLIGGLAIGSVSAQKVNAPFPAFDREAHRGGRGLMPENTIPAMLNAVNLGIETLEMDARITADGKVVLSHDEHINALFSLNTDGAAISKEEADKLVIFKMNCAELAKYDVGTKPYSAFPNQKKIRAKIPLLADVIDSVQHRINATRKRQVFYNIETKITPDKDGIANPEPAVFVKLLMELLTEKKVLPYVIIQSFDKRTIEIIHKKYPDVRTSWLVNNKKTTAENLADLNYKPFIYSPNAKMVSADVVRECHEQGIKVVPWTVNSKTEIELMKAMGVDGIITDYPDLLL